jgi:hypothetical protein
MTVRLHSRTEIEEAREFAQAIVDTVREFFLVLDQDLRAARSEIFQAEVTATFETRGAPQLSALDRRAPAPRPRAGGLGQRAGPRVANGRKPAPDHALLLHDRCAR